MPASMVLPGDTRLRPTSFSVYNGFLGLCPKDDDADVGNIDERDISNDSEPEDVNVVNQAETLDNAIDSSIISETSETPAALGGGEVCVGKVIFVLRYGKITIVFGKRNAIEQKSWEFFDLVDAETRRLSLIFLCRSMHSRCDEDY